jgi:hypothetical protein
MFYLGRVKAKRRPQDTQRGRELGRRRVVSSRVALTGGGSVVDEDYILEH